MTSQERMAQLSMAVVNLSQAMELMLEHQNEHDALALQHETRIRANEEFIRASEQEIAAIRTRMRENTTRIQELIAVANQMQAEITRLDSAP